MKKIGVVLCIAVFMASCAKPLADFVVKQDNTTVPSTVSFENTSKNAERYVWDFGDGNSSVDTNAMNRYLLSGKYEITLIAEKGNKKSMSKKEIILNAPDICLVEIETNYGNMLVQLYDDTPKHRDNFTKLAEEGYYNGLLFHRVIDGFMIQGGDPNSRDAKAGSQLGMGGPGYTIDAEILPNRAHIKGALAAARQGDQVNPEKKSSGSQFYIVHGRPVSERDVQQFANRNGIDYPKEVVEAYIENGGTPFLDQAYTVFGMVVDGIEIIDAIAAVKKGRSDRPEKDVIIKKVTLIK